MGGEIGRAWIGKHIGEAMSAHGLQRVAEAGLLVTVIDDQAGERRVLGAAAKLAHERVCLRSCFLDGIIRCRVREKPILVLCFTINKGEAAFAVACDQSFAPGPAAADELPDGQRIDELVGDDYLPAPRRARHTSEAVRPNP